MSNLIILILAVFIGCILPSFFVKLCLVDRSMVDRPADRLNGDNINVMLERMEDWQQITKDKFLSLSDMSMIDGSTATIPITAEIARQFFDAKDEELGQYYIHNTTHYAYLGLIDKTVQSVDMAAGKRPVSLIFVTAPSEEEKDYAAQKGVELDIQPVALDGFVFITNKNNPVDSLTVGQIQDIYSGKITNWKEVGGNDEEIVAYQREKNSGSQTAMEQLVMKDKPLIEPPKTLITEGMGMLIERVAEYQNDSCSIGYTYYYYMNNLYKNDDIKIIAVNGVTPENHELISGNYPFSTAYYAVIRADEPQDSTARRLRDYMLSQEGQRLVEQAGYCPVKE